jgi:XTP/dITP diphosphohydrolase
MELVFASTNPNKAAEIQELLAELDVRVLGLAEAGCRILPPAEDADSFRGNARIKAIAYAEALGRFCLADDSGLVVDGLGGAPGVSSAHYAGHEGTREERDRRNRQKLIYELGRRPDQSRVARLVCALCFASPKGEVLFETESSMEGVIVDQARGERGFGYDAHLWLPDAGITAAELSSDERNTRSHRGQAVRAFLNWFRLQTALKG